MNGQRIRTGLSIAVPVPTTSLYLALAFRAGRLVDVVRLAYFNDCTNRAYQAHWPNPRRYTGPLAGNFITSTHLFALAEIWVAGRPSLHCSQVMPQVCPGI